MIEAAQAEVRRLTDLREQSHSHLRDLHARLGDMLEKSVGDAPDDTLGPADDVLRPTDAAGDDKTSDQV